MTGASADPTDRLGPYRLLRELGRGGQAIVWLAEDTRIGRKVALKVLPKLGPGSDAILARFRREAEVTSRLEHPAICPVYEADLEGGVPYIAMRFIEGETLARRIQLARDAGRTAVEVSAKPDDWKALATFFAKAARALHQAHEVGVVHRDVKPANIMVTPEGEPVLLDFGLARQDDPESQVLSLSAEHTGTPAYMSPEQMTGRSRPDRRSDVYSLGCSLFESLTLRQPFEAATLEALFQAILNQDVRSARSVNAAVPEDLAVVTATACEKERERRYKTAADFATDLERFVRNEPIAARPITRTQRFVRWSKRNPALATSLFVITGLALVATGLLSYGIGASGRAELEAQLRQKAEAEQRRAEAEKALLVETAAIHDLAGRVDELVLKLDTLKFGLPGGREAVHCLLPAFQATLKQAGIDLAATNGFEDSKAAIARLLARDGDAGRSLQRLLRAMDSFDDLEPERAKAYRALHDSMLDPRLAPLIAARDRWLRDKVDDFDPLLTQKATAKYDAELLTEIARVLFPVQGREDSVFRLLDRALLKRPDSYPTHFMRGGLAIRLAARDLSSSDCERLLQDSAKHFEIAMALRPRSGLTRSCFASAQALISYVTKNESGFAISREALQAATEVEPDNELVWFYKADFLRHDPRMREPAIEACKKALALQPEFTPAQKLLAELTK